MKRDQIRARWSSNVRNLRGGDYVQLTGQRIRGGVFDVIRINRG
jgi:hypothetical protein